MAKGRRRKGKRKAKRRAPDEVLEFGPARIARFGRMTVIESNWDLAEFKQFQDSLPKLREEAESSLKQRIPELRQLVGKYDPLELLASLFTKNSLCDPTSYTESSATGHEYEAEYVFSTLMAIPEGELEWQPLQEGTVEAIQEALDGIYADMRSMILLDPPKKKNLGLEEFRVQMLLNHLIVRGDSYPQHHVDLVSAIAQPHDGYLSSKYGFTASQFVATFQAVEQQIQTRIDEQVDLAREMARIHKGAFERVDDEDLANAKSKEDLAALFRSLVSEEDKEGLRKAAARARRNARDFFSIDLGEAEICKEVLEACAAAPGDNAEFLSGKFAGYPTADTNIWSKPVLQLGGEYLCPAPVVFARASLEVIEGLLLRDDDYSERYQSERAKTLERLAVDYLSTLLPGCTALRSLYYATTDGTRAETDAVVLFDRYLFVVEAKSRGLSLPARRGAPLRIRDDFARIVEGAFSQGNRVIDFIMGSDEVTFEHEDGSLALKLRKAHLDEIFIVNPTLAAMNPLGVQLRLAREKGLLSHGNHWPWCIYINDLRIVSELIDSPSEFILFLQRRLDVNALVYAPHDELDLLCKFFDDGLYHEKGELKDVHRFGIHGYTDMLDRWYIGREHGADVEKPGRAIPGRVRDLAHSLEKTSKSRRIAAAMRITELDHEGLRAINSFLESKGAECLANGTPHDLSMQFKQPFLRGVSIYVNTDGKLTSAALSHAAMRKHLSGASEWLAISVRARDGVADFSFLPDGSPPPELIQEVDRICRRRLADYQRAHGRLPGRNDECPCMSGRKYKKCCRRLAEVGAFRTTDQ